jgi:hypothetical protein
VSRSAVGRHEVVEENRLIVGTSHAVLSSRHGWPGRKRLASSGGPRPSASGGDEGSSGGASFRSWCRGQGSASSSGGARRPLGRTAHSFAGPVAAAFGTFLSGTDPPIVGAATAGHGCGRGGWIMVRTDAGGSARQSGVERSCLRATVVPPHRVIVHREEWSAGAGLRKAVVPFDGWSADRSQDVPRLPSNPASAPDGCAAGEKQQRYAHERMRRESRRRRIDDRG